MNLFAARYKMILVLLLLAATGNLVLAQQQYSTRSNRALRLYLDGKKAYEFYDFRVAEQKLKEAVAADEGFFEAHMLMGEMFFDLRRFEEAAESYLRAVILDAEKFPNARYFLASAYLKSGNYEPALHYFTLFIESGKGSPSLIPDARKGVASCEFSIIAVANPVPFVPVSLGVSAGSGFNDYSPAVTADGNMIMFTRETLLSRDALMGRRTREDFFISYRNEDATWSQPLSAGAPLNTSGNEGAQTIGPGGQYMYFTACNRPDGLGRCDIYFSMFDGRTWSQPKNIGAPVNSEYWESQPSISADGKTLYFVSNRPGGLGGMDIWISDINEDGSWGQPYNAGDVINTPGDETTPFIHFDGKTLYFSSNGRPNMGGHDIYVTRRQDDDRWSEPANLGYPINTHRDEMGLTIESNGIRAYYSSTATPGGEKGLFWFDLHEEARPEQVSFLRGRVFDSETGRTLVARYELTNLTSGDQVASELTATTGEFLVCLPSGFNYGLNITAEGYLFYSENFPFDGEYTDFQPLVKDIPLRLIKQGEKLVLYNVLFDVNSSEIIGHSEPELNKLLAMLLGNPSMTVEISGHTDDTGSAVYNQTLSEARALAVVRYLTENGIESSRMTYKGYGMTKPVADNTTTEGRRLNRRTEVIITGSYP